MTNNDKMPKFRLLENRVLLEILDQEIKTKAGILLPKRSQAEEQIRARVILTGEFCDEDLNPGDIVYIREDSGASITLPEGKFFITRDFNVLVVEHPRAKNPFEAVGLLRRIVAEYTLLPEHQGGLSKVIEEAKDYLK